MKASDLMVGDWVMQICVGEQRFNHPIKIGLHELIRVQAALSNSDDRLDVRPIPLTPKILEKNGFEKQQVYIGIVFAFDDDDQDAHVIIHPKEDNYTRGAYTYIHVEHGCLSLDELPIEYVHDLQHALRLCRIEKTIEL